MIVVSSEHELRVAIAAAQTRGETVGFVPTMGALHEGHATLLKQAERDCDLTVLSIYVNPTQFGPNEDLAKYPRTLESDLEIARKVGVNIVFTPTNETIYPAGFSTSISVGAVAEPLCGKFRPGHFSGVATVVCKLFQLVQPTRAYFGQKDLQQCLVIRRMVADLNIPVELCFVPTVRESDGLAMSSRNRYLSSEDRGVALAISKALQAAEVAYKSGERSARAIELAARAVLEAQPEFRIQYLELRSLPDLQELQQVEGPVVLAIAAFLGKTRLIDNTSFGFAL